MRPKLIDPTKTVCSNPKCGAVGVGYLIKGECRKCYGAKHFRKSYFGATRDARIKRSDEWNKNHRAEINAHRIRRESGTPLPTKSAPPICTNCDKDRIVFSKGLCLPCYGKNRNKQFGQRNRVGRWAKILGVTREEIDGLAAAADGRCAICNITTKLVLDHDHTTNALRGFLCSPCNLMLGFMEQAGPSNLLSAVAYLIKHQASNYTTKESKGARH